MSPSKLDVSKPNEVYLLTKFLSIQDSIDTELSIFGKKFSEIKISENILKLITIVSVILNSENKFNSNIWRRNIWSSCFLYIGKYRILCRKFAIKKEFSVESFEKKVYNLCKEILTSEQFIWLLILPNIDWISINCDLLRLVLWSEIASDSE